MKTILCILCIGLVGCLNTAKLTFDNGFEKGDLTGFICSGNCPTVTTSPVASGKYPGNFDLTRSMATSYRTEVVLGEKGKFEWSTEYWVGFRKSIQ